MSSALAVVNKLMATRFRVQGEFDGSCSVRLGKRSGIPVRLPPAVADDLARELNDALIMATNKIKAMAQESFIKHKQEELDLPIPTTHAVDETILPQR